jgi:gliding motility-associated-like protein
MVTDSVQVTYYPKPSVNITGNNLTGCAPVTSTFSASINSSFNIAGCLWRFEDGEIIYDPSCSGVSKEFNVPGGNDVYLTVIESNGCQTEVAKPSMVVVHSKPEVNFYMYPEGSSGYTNYTTVLYPTIQFVDSTYTFATAITDWEWTFFGNSDTSGILGYADIQNPVFVFPSDTGTYPVKLEVTNQQGCKSDTTINLIITGDLSFYIPNAFTPDGDGTNDFFGPEGIGIDENYELMIFNRWGQMIWHNISPGEKWNGIVRDLGDGTKLAQDGVYVWKLIFKTALLTGENERRYIKYGTVTLLK